MPRNECFAVWMMVGLSSALASSVSGQSLDTPMTRLRPIGAPSAVDLYRPPVQGTLVRETAYQAPPMTGDNTGYPVRQAVMMQQPFEAPTLPGGATANPSAGGLSGGGFALPPGTSSPAITSAPPATTALPGNLVPVPMDSRGIVSSGDYVPMSQPQLGTGFATIDNCNCVTAPSSYVAASFTPGCAPVGYQGPVGYQPISQVSVPAAPVGYAPRGAGIPPGPLFSFGQERNPVQVGQGILGQPVAYVPGQRVRNWIRYFFP